MNPYIRSTIDDLAIEAVREALCILLKPRFNPIFGLEVEIKTLTQRFSEKQQALLLGRGCHYPIALNVAARNQGAFRP